MSSMVTITGCVYLYIHFRNVLVPGHGGQHHAPHKHAAARKRACYSYASEKCRASAAAAGLGGSGGSSVWGTVRAHASLYTVRMTRTTGLSPTGPARKRAWVTDTCPSASERAWDMKCIRSRRFTLVRFEAKRACPCMTDWPKGRHGHGPGTERVVRAHRTRWGTCRDARFPKRLRATTTGR